jgi:hypothetical protein
MHAIKPTQNGTSGTSGGIRHCLLNLATTIYFLFVDVK